MIRIVFEKSDKRFRCGEPIRGRVEWSGFESKIERVEIRLVWYTRGKGDQDLAVVAQHGVPSFDPNGSADFEFTAPRSPYSFSAKLISLVWAVEVDILPARKSESAEIVIGPQAREIMLTESPGDE